MHFASTLFALISVPSICLSAPSKCYGTVSNGRIERAVKLQVKGSNYSSYSSVGSALGRTYVHSTVREIIELSFAQVRKELPETVFVYGETGWESGGRIRPHKTHQNGTSIDFLFLLKIQLANLFHCRHQWAINLVTISSSTRMLGMTNTQSILMP
jgi:penicillin-insensitive murein DD-endopeptidase